MAVSFEMFARPALRALAGFRDIERRRITATAKGSWRVRAGKMQVIPVVLDEDEVRPHVPDEGEVSLFDEPADESGAAAGSEDEDLFGEDATETPAEPDEDDVEEKADGDTVTLSQADLDADLAAILDGIEDDEDED